MMLPSIVVNQVIDALGDFLELIAANDVEIIRGQVNRTPMPPDPCIVLTEVLQAGLQRPYVDYRPDDDEADIKGSKRIDIQIDIYGDDAGDYCTGITLAFNSQYSFDNFPENIKPLYLSEGHQAPLITGEQQYENRWTLTASIQYNPVLAVPQEFADELSPTIHIPVDLTQLD